MKISMWMIAEKLGKYQPKCAIVEGKACMTGVRFISSEGSQGFDPQYLYLSVENETETAMLCNGRDMLLLQGQDTNQILNDLLAAFDFYNSWEKDLWEASAHKSFQQIIDLGDAVLGNPMMLADMDGKVLAMSSAYIDEDINEYWIESRASHRVPTAVLGSPMRTMDGRLGSWTDEPNIFLLPDGTKTIGTFLRANGELIAGFGLWEHRRPILHSDIEVVRVLYQVLISTIDAQKRSAPVRSGAAILADLLSGVQIDEALVDRLELRCHSPWRLLVIVNPFRNDPVIRRNLVQRLQSVTIPCVPLLFDDHAVALVSEADVTSLLDQVLGQKDRQYYQAVLSLPFSDLFDIRVRHSQILFALKQAGGKPGIYRSEDSALACLLDLFREENRRQKLSHPALEQLRRYDAEHGSELYKTLYQYLQHERSIQQGADAMHIHKNTFLYRLQKIRTIIDADLDDPTQRNYLLFSCWLDQI